MFQKILSKKTWLDILNSQKETKQTVIGEYYVVKILWAVGKEQREW